MLCAFIQFVPHCCGEPDVRLWKRHEDLRRQIRNREDAKGRDPHDSDDLHAHGLRRVQAVVSRLLVPIENAVGSLRRCPQAMPVARQHGTSGALQADPSRDHVRANPREDNSRARLQPLVH
ncbi:hypothetical protein L596_015520 [Steinernema carpocapsae]|uniref:Uncharacterized protein n=1 Tax=Steinernema carpocapsae TaxID=34508 RepID=A0A4U5NFE1_STECR|nr:hypothetical protein L596_015520 [Steinernema carpocapsae]